LVYFSGVLFFLYWFIFALELLGAGAKVLTGCSAAGLFGDNTNPVAALIVGMLVTVLLQSSSTTTSIIVSLVGSNAIGVESAIYMVMGANIGTSVTNTIVAMGQMGNGDELERAFAGATVHDMFNFLSVLILFPVEVITGYLDALTSAMVKNFTPKDDTGDGLGGIKTIIAPILDRVIKSNSKVIDQVATGAVSSCDEYYPTGALEFLPIVF
jgi:sodium-dependent phosphate cotransporter